ncbi:efflux RND transporter periplasmic adaptor subunit [Paenibacillus sp. GSMTC-2017]|uniref:efflux RND transporter periplasmic adaptor subunit n=1 Tax=Paenibacillus sp. GSMTC-2017 TaxID=2794350 RepID=UPI0018D8CED8|nr:efflux RND transporter periplasmic adaptor subunit [Paenibacillus sp. GSMTC-2017]MBH5316199.1 efflux RND transporter periplasmic adaptor subunit [Paenibacillus sp. GSMTC-2017]
MELFSEKHPGSRQKRGIKLVIVVFIAALLILTLYSNTILTMNLPRVWTEEGRSDPLLQQYNGSGLLKPISEVKLTNRSGWIVKEVLIKEGDRVKKGQTLVVYDSRDTESTIQSEQANLSKQKLMIEGLQEQFIAATQSEDELSIRSAKRAIQAARLDLSVQEQKISNLQADLESFKTIVAPFDGYISKVSAMTGLPSGSEGSDVIVTNSSLGFQFNLHIPYSIAEQMELGSTLEVDIKKNKVTRSVEGKIVGIETVVSDSQTLPTGELENRTSSQLTLKQVVIAVQSPELKGGEQANVSLSKSSENDEGMLLPLKAIHGHGDNKYIFVLEEKQGPLGNTYHANKVNVTLGESNEADVIVLEGAFPGQSIITESSEPIQDGDRVRKR